MSKSGHASVRGSHSNTILPPFLITIIAMEGELDLHDDTCRWVDIFCNHIKDRCSALWPGRVDFRSAFALGEHYDVVALLAATKRNNDLLPPPEILQQLKDVMKSEGLKESHVGSGLHKFPSNDIIITVCARIDPRYSLTGFRDRSFLHVCGSFSCLHALYLHISLLYNLKLHLTFYCRVFSVPAPAI